MRIIITADLHYDVPRSKAPTETIAEQICQMGGDALLIVGDCVSTDLTRLDELLSLFERFSGVKLLVAGNHELWTLGGDSLHRYETELLAACRRSGVHYLDAQPYQADGVAFVGNIGWYDYSYRPADLKIPLRFYQNKVAPGAAAHLEQHRHLVGDDVAQDAMSIGTRWMDGARVKLPVGDVEFTHGLAAKLRAHLQGVHDRADRVVVGIHHLPFSEMLPKHFTPNWAFVNAFMGSDLFGEVLLDFPKVSHVYCGHSHQPKRCRKRHLECINVGSTYREKRYEILEV